MLTKETEAIDDFESHLGEATEKFERNRGKFERVARTGHRWAGWQWDGNGMATWDFVLRKMEQIWRYDEMPMEYVMKNNFHMSWLSWVS